MRSGRFSTRILSTDIGRAGSLIHTSPDGKRSPQLEVPLTTYTGRNLRDPKTGMPNERVSFLGSFFPLAKTKADADPTGDSRQPIAERYHSREEYLDKFRAAAVKLADDRFLLPDDVDTLVARGGEGWDYVTK